MKNFDFIWVREHAGLTQAQAAELMGVVRKTVVRWENGQVQIPNRKWHAFLKAVTMTESQLPKHREYTKDGYPMGFDRSQFDFRKPKYFLYTDADGNDIHNEDAAAEDEEAALKLVEGEEYESRSRERYRLLLASLYGSSPNAKMQISKDMAEYDARRAAPSAEDLV